uniref:Uncharacterized protein n=1 Tax=Rhizophora mucronata TaxID=61149 RepID=A0A2P2KA01_RHIMU
MLSSFTISCRYMHLGLYVCVCAYFGNSV